MSQLALIVHCKACGSDFKPVCPDCGVIPPAQPKEDAPVSENNEPMISVSSLRRLADESKHCGADRYSEAYRLVADRLEEVSKAEPPTGSPAPPNPTCTICGSPMSKSYVCKKDGSYPGSTPTRVDSPAEGADPILEFCQKKYGSYAGSPAHTVEAIKEFWQIYAGHERERAERLQRELEDAIDTKEEATIAKMKAEAEIAELRKQVRELADALDLYGNHNSDCYRLNNGSHPPAQPCDCGLDAILKKVRK